MFRHTLGYHLYTAIRQTAITAVAMRQRLQGHPMDLESVIHWGDAVLRQIPPSVLRCFACTVPAHVRTDFLGLSFRSPLVAASFKEDPHMLLFWYQLGLGAVIYKTVLGHPRSGNVRPRIQDLGDRGLINAMGLPGPGVEALAQQIETHANAVFDLEAPIGVSVGGENAEEYTHVFDRLNKAISRHDVFFEVNISCPNTDEGRSLLAHPELLEALLGHMRNNTDRVIGVKLSPDQSDEALCRFVEVIRGIPRTYVNLGNTQYKTCQGVGLSSTALSRGGGGLSGPLLFARTREMVRLIAPMGVPIMATGGIGNVAQVRDIREAGATLVGMATALVKNSFVIPRILSGL